MLCVERLWLAPLPSRFWVGEMGTRFVVLHGATHPSFAAAPQVPASVYYWLPRMAQALFGMSEVAYRLPSVLLMALSLLWIARIARRLIHADAGWFAVFACLFPREFNFEAADARPHPLGTCVASAGLLCPIRWLDTGHWPDAAPRTKVPAVWRRCQCALLARLVQRTAGVGGLPSPQGGRLRGRRCTDL